MVLLTAESRMFDLAQPSEERETTDQAVNERYSRGEVRIVTEQARYPLTAIKDMVDSPSYELNPEFQRRHRWDDDRKSRLIESFIMNVPIPPIFLYEAKFSYYEVMDGLQRLSAIRDFYSDAFKLTGLVEWSDLNGRTYSTLPEEVRRGVDRRYLSSIILLHETAKSEHEAQRLKQLVFERINSGGEKLTHQESRNAVYPGPLNSLCLELARADDLCRLWHIPTASAVERSTGTADDNDPVLGNKLYSTMGDAELVLRFFAYRQQLDQQSGRALRDYLDDFLRRGNLLPQPEIEELGRVFRATCALVIDLFGEGALFLPKVADGGWQYANRPTLTIYDPLLWATSQHLDATNDLLKNKGVASQLLHKMYVENIERFSGRTANASDMRARNVMFTELFEAILLSTGTLDDAASTPSESVIVDEFVDEAIFNELSASEGATSGE